jgi:hypothetical protein
MQTTGMVSLETLAARVLKTVGSIAPCSFPDVSAVTGEGRLGADRLLSDTVDIRS